jgi:hypothetical protein
VFLNIARWLSWEAFAEAFKSAEAFDPDIETGPRESIVLEVVSEWLPGNGG